MALRPPVQVVVEEQAELNRTWRHKRMALFNSDGSPFAGGGDLFWHASDRLDAAPGTAVADAPVRAVEFGAEIFDLDDNWVGGCYLYRDAGVQTYTEGASLASFLPDDSLPRISVRADDSSINFGNGTDETDVKLYRFAPNSLKLGDDDVFLVGTDGDPSVYIAPEGYIGIVGPVTPNSALEIQSKGDSGAKFKIWNNGNVHSEGTFRMKEQGTDPNAPSDDYGVFFLRDNGSGKTQFCIRFATGAVQVIATQP